MRTPNAVKTIIADYLQATVPARCTTHGTTAPAAYFPHGYRQLGPDEWPAVFVSEQDRSHQLLEHDNEGNPVFDVHWQFAIEAWVRSNEHDDWTGVTDHRGRLELALLEALLDKPGLIAEGLVVDDAGVVSDYSPLFEIKQGPPACAVELRFTVHTAELLDRAALADPDLDIEVDTEPLEE